MGNLSGTQLSDLALERDYWDSQAEACDDHLLDLMTAYRRDLSGRPVVKSEPSVMAEPEVVDSPEPEADPPPARDVLIITNPDNIIRLNLGEKNRHANRIVDEELYAHREICAFHQLREGDLWSAWRPGWLSVIRQKIWWRWYNEVKLTLPQIAARSGDRDHTTILAGIRRFEKQRGEKA